MTPDLLRNIAVFAEVAKAKSFTKAGLALDLPKSTVSRRVAELEREVGLRLLKRTTQKVELTEEGQNYFASCRRLLEDVQSAHEELISARHRPRGHLRVAATVDFGLRLVNGLTRFAAEYPDLVLEFDFTTRRVDPLTENYDVAIHIGAPPDSGLTAKKLADVAVHVYASPDYLAGHGRPLTPADLSAHACVLEGRLHQIGIQNTWTLTNGRRRVEVDVKGTLSFNSIGIIRRLILGGAGLALLPESICRKDVEAGRLVRVLENWSAPMLPIYALTSTRLMPAKTRTFLDFVQANL
ncbi:HTH-type transcriptional regulator DmlR [Pigmentiphaga humi]|uniref:HTH-type transcriptional regulator DmlR n=1 Tax=Pigmentiphaga humi TaxID=2478468 RepID=A0A3P4AXS3_9BURK|nr:LysR family transcriptional regulator [Pigmentiphaga humi]VCU68827.1 HTH-type transcriptional regulator DmlR [Pigmentiphaga humi]